MWNNAHIVILQKIDERSPDKDEATFPTSLDTPHLLLTNGIFLFQNKYDRLLNHISQYSITLSSLSLNC